MKTILMVSNTASMQYQFLLPWTLLLREMGYEVHIACNFEEGNNASPERIAQFCAQLDDLGIRRFQIDFDRNALKLHKYKKPLAQLDAILEAQPYEAIHCHSPIGGVCGRIAGKRRGVKVLYTAHGFHFFKGAPLLNWMLFYPAERMLAHWTDTLITINHEDFSRAQNFRAGTICRIPGAGVALERYRTASRSRSDMRAELGIPEDAVVFLSIGELNRNKNHTVLLRALHQLQDPQLHLVIAGTGALMVELASQAEKLGIADRVHILGFRTDVPELLHMADVFCFPSKREGLGFTAIEAMAAGLPLITSNRHGILDYSKDGITGFACDPEDAEAFADAMRTLAADGTLRRTMGRHNAGAAEAFALETVIAQMRGIYETALGAQEVPAPVPEEAVR